MVPIPPSSAITASPAMLAQAIVAATVREAQKRSVRVCVAVVDPGGHLVAFLRMDGMPFHLIGVAQDKAITAASFGMPTSELAFGLTRHSKAAVEFFRGREHLVLLGGGIPLHRGSELIGGVGVTGSSEAEDEACALAAVKTCLKDTFQSEA
ncbi:heme-binding protein [Polaromonas hydrogenivorans]